MPAHVVQRMQGRMLVNIKRLLRSAAPARGRLGAAPARNVGRLGAAPARNVGRLGAAPARKVGRLGTALERDKRKASAEKRLLEKRGGTRQLAHDDSS
jgi:hypothetical protein